MSQPLVNTGRFPKKSNSVVARAAVVFLTLSAALAITVPSARAGTSAMPSCQTELMQYIPGPANILTCTQAQLVTALQDAIASSGTNTPDNLAEAAISAYPYGQQGQKVRSDLNTVPSVAAVVADATINELVKLGSTSNAAAFPSEVGGIVDHVMEANENSSAELTLPVREEIANKAVASIVEDYLGATTALPQSVVMSGLVSIGNQLAGDSHLEGLAGNALVAIAQNAMIGITGTSGSTLGAIQAASSLAYGLTASGTVPDSGQGETFSTFAVALLSNVATNTSVDTYVAYELGKNDNNANPTALISMGKALFAAYPAAEVQVTQGLTDSIQQGNANETNRVSFTNAFVTADVSAAVNILQGAVFADPYYAGGTSASTGFTYGVFNSIYSSSPSTLLTDATSAAVAIGNILGTDGNELTQVAQTYSSYIGAGKLSVALTGTYATELINGAVHSTVPTSAFAMFAPGAGGGKLVVGTGITTATVTDLASITDVFADGIVTSYGSTIETTGSAAAASAIGRLAEAVASFTLNETVRDSHSTSDPVAVFVAATLDNYIVSLGLHANVQDAIISSITADIEAVVSDYHTALANEGTFAEANNGSDQYTAITGPIAVQETTVTNL